MTRHPRVPFTLKLKTARLAALALAVRPIVLAACGSSDGGGGGGPGY